MRSLIAASVLLALGVGALAVAGAEEPGCPPVPKPAIPGAVAPAPHPFVVPHPIAAAAAPEKGSEAGRIEHLREAAAHLRAAGLDSLAEHVRGLATPPFAPESPRETGPSRPDQKGAQPVIFTIKLVELDERLGLDLSQVPSCGGIPVSEKALSQGRPAMTTFGPDSGLVSVVETACRRGLARVLSEPKLVTLIGTPASLRVGGEIPLWALGPDGQPVQHSERYGTSVDVVPHLADHGNLRLELRCEISEVDRTKTVVVAGKENPAIRKWSIDTGVEMKPGHTLVAVRHGPPASGDAKGSRGPTTLLLVTPEVVDPVAALPSPDRFQRR